MFDQLMTINLIAFFFFSTHSQSFLLQPAYELIQVFHFFFNFIIYLFILFLLRHLIIYKHNLARHLSKPKKKEKMPAKIKRQA